MSMEEEILDDGLLAGEGTNFRKRGCSPASSSSSVVQNYRFKRAILVAKRGGSGGGGSSTTPLPTWRTVRSRSSPMISAVRVAGGQSPKYSRMSRSKQPVSARKLAATLWELNSVPSPSPAAALMVKGSIGGRRREKEGKRIEDLESSLRSHVCDLSRSPVSERWERPRTGQTGHESLISSRPKVNDRSLGVLDSISDASFMEIETRSICQTPAGSTIGTRSRLKCVRNALTTSKELLRIISRLWHQDDRPSSSMSLMSAIHIELEKARLQVNQLILEENPDRSEGSHAFKQFEEKATWKDRECGKAKVATKSVMEELDVERKLRRQYQSLNKKLGLELAEVKASLLRVSKDLESERRAREFLELICDELTRKIGTDKARLKELKRENARTSEKAEKERETSRTSDASLDDDRAQKKPKEAKHHFKEKNAVVNKLVEAFLRRKEDARGSTNRRKDGDLIGPDSGSCRRAEREDHGERDEDGVDYAEGFADSDLHSTQSHKDELNKESSSNSRYLASKNPKSPSIDEQLKEQTNNSVKGSRRSTSDINRRDTIADVLRESGSKVTTASEKLLQRRSFGDEISRRRSVKSLQDQIASSSRRRESK